MPHKWFNVILDDENFDKGLHIEFDQGCGYCLELLILLSEVAEVTTYSYTSLDVYVGPELPTVKQQGTAAARVVTDTEKAEAEVTCTGESSKTKPKSKGDNTKISHLPSRVIWTNEGVRGSGRGGLPFMEIPPMHTRQFPKVVIGHHVLIGGLI